MKFIDAAALARSLLDRHGLATWPLVWQPYWYVDAGRCYRPLSHPRAPKNGWIHISIPFVLVNPEENVMEIVLHEIAHALTHGGHEEMWQAVAKAIGCSGLEFPVLVLPAPGGGAVMGEGEEVRAGVGGI